MDSCLNPYRRLCRGPATEGSIWTAARPDRSLQRRKGECPLDRFHSDRATSPEANGSRTDGRHLVPADPGVGDTAEYLDTTAFERALGVEGLRKQMGNAYDAIRSGAIRTPRHSGGAVCGVEEAKPRPHLFSRRRNDPGSLHGATGRSRQPRLFYGCNLPYFRRDCDSTPRILFTTELYFAYRAR